MNYTENYKGIKIDVQSHNMALGDTVQGEIRSAIDKLSKHTHDINAADFYFKNNGGTDPDSSSLGVRIGIPGPDVFAEERGHNEIQLLKSVVTKLIKQLDKK